MSSPLDDKMLQLEYLAKAHREQLNREADNERLIALARQSSTKKRISYRPILVWIGSRLCRLGSWLEKQFQQGEIYQSVARAKNRA